MDPSVSQLHLPPPVHLPQKSEKRGPDILQHPALRGNELAEELPRPTSNNYSWSFLNLPRANSQNRIPTSTPPSLAILPSYQNSGSGFDDDHNATLPAPKSKRTKLSKRPRLPASAASTTSDSSTYSFDSMKSTSSSDSLMYILKKQNQNLELPFNNPNATPADVQRFMGLVKEREKGMKRNVVGQSTFQGFWFLLLVCILYFVMIGFPLWDGVVYKLWKVAHLELPWWGSLFFVGWAALTAWPALMFGRFEKTVDDPESRDASETCLIIPAYKAAGALRDTIPHALKIFKPEQIFIIANGNSPTPMDNTEDVCKEFGVNHFWVPIGSKIIAEFMGVFLAKKYKYCILIDDDVHLPANLPIVSDRITGNVACVGYGIKSTGANGSKGTVFQQAQDMEYKLAGITKTFSSKYGSSTFPHGAIILWDRKILETLFFGHPGYTISEDWYFGHTARCLGYRVDFCTQVFVETETPPCFLIPSKSSRGGYGEMTIFSQRFYRWNFFFLYRLVNDLSYLIFAWRLGWREIITKFYVFEEVWGSLIYLVLPFMMPIMLAACWQLTLQMTAGVMAIYIVSYIVFNAVHLRQKKEMIAWKIMPVYFAMKFVLVFINAASVYYSMYAYAKYFSVKHSRVVDKHDVLQVLKDLLAAQAQKDAEYEAEQESLIRPGREVVESVVQSEKHQQDKNRGELAQEQEIKMMPQAEAIQDVERRRLDDMRRISDTISQYSQPDAWIVDP